MKVILLLLIVGLVASQKCSNCLDNKCINSVCQQCIQDYFIDTSGSCGRYTPIEGCKIYMQATVKCSQCLPGRLLQAGRCLNLIPNCNQTVTNNINLCSKCNDTYVLVNDINCYSSQIERCPQGSLPRVLKSTSQPFCQKFQLLKCSQPDSTAQFCESCIAGSTSINGVCNNVSSQTPCPGNSCACQYYYANDICYQLKLEGCLSSADFIYCDLCNDTFIAVDGRCYQPVKYLDTHCNVLQVNSNICTGCNFQYYLDPNNICVMNIDFCVDTSKSCQSQCSSPNLLFYSGKCYLKDHQCISYDTTLNKCVKCFEGYVLDQNFICQRIQKCWIYANYLTTSGVKVCQTCFTGYQLNTVTFICAQLPKECVKMNNNGTCLTCSDFTVLVNQQTLPSQAFPSNASIPTNANVCVYSTPNCKYYNSFGFCQVCTIGYVQQDHLCITVAANCLVSNQADTSKCVTCAIGYQLDTASLTCFARIEGCLKYSSTFGCTQCNTAYNLINTICFYKDNNCLQYNNNANCIRCSNNLVPFGVRCVYFDPYCLSYDVNGICNAAFGGFSQSQSFSSSMQSNYKAFINATRNIQPSSNSASSSSSDQLALFGGYYTAQGFVRVLTSTGLSHSRIAQYDVNGKIRSCKSEYTLLNGICVVSTNNCAKYSSTMGICTRCNSFYHLGPARQCITWTSAICPIPTPNGEFCTKCGSGYTLVNGQCTYSANNIASSGSGGGSGSVSGMGSSSNSSGSLSTQAGYFISKNYQTAFPYDQNCASQIQAGQCLQCTQQSSSPQRGMQLINGRCLQIQNNCQQYSDKGICTRCITGYNLYYAQCFLNNCLSIAPIDGVCSSCSYLMGYQAGICYNKAQANCLIYDQLTSFTAAIKSVRCTSCVAGYYVKSDFTCQQMIVNCLVTDAQSGRCTQCIFGMIVYNQQCIKQIPNCQTYSLLSGFQSCIRCGSNYFLINNRCLTLPFRCLQLNSSGMCQKCLSGYNPIVQSGVSICIFPVVACSSYSLQGRCNTCNPNHILQNNLCNFYMPGCQNFSTFTNGSTYCIKCLTGYYLINGFCINDANCVTADNIGTCLTCVTGYQLISKICYKNDIDNCLVQQANVCLQCANGYISISVYDRNYCLLRQIAYSGCSNQTYPCAACKVGFTLNNDGFCYAINCLDTISQLSMRQCTSCYPYFLKDPSSSFCIYFNCNNPTCYSSSQSLTSIPTGFIRSTQSGFLIVIQYSSNLTANYTCTSCSNYRFPNVATQWSLCYPRNCQSLTVNCSGNCVTGYGNNVIDDQAVCTANYCQVYAADGTCQNCTQPYTLSNGICLYQGPCANYNSVTAKCSLCKNGYIMNSLGQCSVSNCSSYPLGDSTTCAQCSPGYELTPNKTCQIKFCLSSYQYSSCPKCMPGYTFSVSTSLCLINNCLLYDYLNNVCLTCANVFTISSNYCSPVNCIAYNYTISTCLKCIDGYSVNSNGGCSIANCCAFNQMTCANCCVGYDYVNGVCRQRCVQFDTNNVCIQCIQGYQISNGQCAQEITGCIAYSDSLCTACQGGLTVLNGICIPKYCASYNNQSATFCTQCQPRFYALPSGLCYPKNCMFFNNTLWLCQQCEQTSNYGFSLVSSQGLCFTNYCKTYNVTNYVCNTCQISLIAQYQLQINNGSEICLITCLPYYRLTNLQCTIKFCANFNTNGQCLQCLPGFDFQQATGLCKLKFCLAYSGESCQQCQSGFVFDQENKKYCVPNNCLNYTIGSNTCLQCQKGYVLEYSLCILADCYLYNNQYVCQKCISGFTLTTIQGVVSCQRTINSTCLDGFYFSSSSSSCSPILINFCRYVSPSQPNLCLSCLSGYYLFNGSCYSPSGCQSYQFSYISGCKQCLAGFKLTEGGVCTKDYCAKYFANYTCQTCVPGYYLYYLECVDYSSFCASGNSIQGCLACQTGYQPVAGICQKLPNFCSSLYSDLTCEQCISGYSLYKNNCYISIQNCVIESGSTCTQCNGSYVLSSDSSSCIKKTPINYCQQYDSTYSNCVVCLSGYTLTSDKKCLAQHCYQYNLANYVCTSCLNETVSGVQNFYTVQNQLCVLININYCSVPVNSTYCQVCFDGFSTTQGVCIAINCQTYLSSNNQLCATCITGFYLTSNNTCKKMPNFCSTVNANGLCSVCLSGYVLTSAGNCVTGTSFCNTYDGNGYCLACQSNYYLTSSRICSSLPINCLNANSIGVCQQCTSAYILSNSGICYMPVNNCSRYTNLGFCAGCSAGFYLNQNNNCLTMLSNCILASVDGVCQQCSSSYRLDTGVCYILISNCASYQGGNCVLCSTNYYPLNNVCYPLPAHCTFLSQPSVCSRCANGYTLYNNICYITIANCFVYNPASDCNTCAPGYYVNLNGNCSALPNNCLNANKDQACAQCYGGFILQSGVCYKQVNNCQSYDTLTSACKQCFFGYFFVSGACYQLPANCLSQNSNGNCLSCTTGFTLQNGICYRQTANCLSYNSTSNLCQQCNSEYYLINGNCYQLGANCLSTDANGNCLSCAASFTLQNGVCYKQLANCSSYNSVSNLCQQCNSGYYLANGNCYLLRANCLSTNTNGDCLSCASAYTLQNGLCYYTLDNCQSYSANMVCASCVNYYYLATNGVCTLNPNGCSQYSLAQGCLNCVTGYTLRSGICYFSVLNCNIYNQTTQSCDQCMSGFYLINNTCYQLPSNCLTLNSQLQCATCQSNYYLLANICYLLPSNCLILNSQKQCQSCVSGFSLQNGICYRTIQFCSTYLDSLCGQCASGYYVNTQGTCTIYPSNCLTAAQNGFCTQCATGYLLQSNACYKFDQNCAAYDSSNLVCQSCANGFYINYQFSCVSLPTSCLSANAYGNCLACQSNYNLLNGVCYLTLSQCIVYDPKTYLCTQCANNYNLINGYCYKTISNCLVYSTDNLNCVKCNDTYVLSNNICVSCGQGQYINNYGACAQNPVNCLYANQYGQCLNCASNYILVDGLCTIQIQFCQNYRSSNGGVICQQCSNGYYSKDLFTCQILPKNCLSADSNGYCTQCSNNYQANSNGVCYTVVPNCVAYQLSSGFCTLCSSTYYLNANQACSLIQNSNCLFANSLGQCVQCANGYVLFGTTCYLALANCFSYSTSVYACATCNQGYYVLNNACNVMPVGCSTIKNNVCIACSQNYQLIANGICQLVSSNCAQYNIFTNQCLACVSNYYLSNGLCYLLPNYCVQVNTNGQCSSCISSSFLSNGVCYQNINFCSQYGLMGLCSQCYTLYYLQNNVCNPYPSNCQSVDSLTFLCTSCVSGYNLVSNQCIYGGSTNCLYYSPLTNQCITCKNSFYEYWLNTATLSPSSASSLTNVNQYCRAYPGYCTNVDLLGNCISCTFGATLTNGICVGNNDRSLNCDNFDSFNFRCITCSAGFFYCDGMAICIQINQNCQTYDNNQRCAQCITGFSLFNGECIRNIVGLSASNSQICTTGYTYTALSQNACTRNKNELSKASLISGVKFLGTLFTPSSSVTGSSSQALSSLLWSPPSYLNNYLSITFPSAQIIHYIQVQGNSNQYVTNYILHFRNKANAPLICWNSCQQIQANINADSIAELWLPYPIVATQVRLYPLKWVNAIAMKVQMLAEAQ